MSKSRRGTTEAVEADRGATMIEYALVVGSIALVVVVAAGVFGQGVLALFDDVTRAL